MSAEEEEGLLLRDLSNKSVRLRHILKNSYMSFTVRVMHTSEAQVSKVVYSSSC